MRHVAWTARTGAVAVAASVCLLVVHAGPAAQGQAAPCYVFDPDFPKPLPNKWKIGGVHMVEVDSKNNIYTGEAFAGQRVQRFVPAGSARGKLLVQLSNMP
jgi:hypothetical protein